jgi:hypothetical protein
VADIDLAAWLRPDEFDLYCIGAQEVEESPGTSYRTLRASTLRGRYAYLKKIRVA